MQAGPGADNRRVLCDPDAIMRRASSSRAGEGFAGLVALQLSRCRAFSHQPFAEIGNGMTGTPDVEWLLSYDDQNQPMRSGGHMSFDDANWKAEIEHVELASDLRLFLADAELRDDLTVEPQRAEPELWLGGNIVARGEMTIVIPSGGSVELNPERGALLSLADKRLTMSMVRRQRLRHLAYMVRQDRVRRMVGTDVPQGVQRLLGGSTAPLELRTTAALRRIVASAFSHSLVGTLRQTFLEGLVAQAFAFQVSASAPTRSPRLTGDQIEVLQEARRVLLSNMRTPPSLGELAGRFGMSEKALNQGFRQLFGTTIFETLRNERLDHARIAIEESSLPLKLIAERVGYRHVANFVSAFSRRYGAPPIRYVRSK